MVVVGGRGFIEPLRSLFGFGILRFIKMGPWFKRNTSKTPMENTTCNEPRKWMKNAMLLDC